jgi:hypothetical protein
MSSLENRVLLQEPIKMVGLKYFFMERKMFEEHVTIKILTFIEQQEGARDPDRRLNQDPEYAFQGVKISCVPELRRC